MDYKEFEKIFVEECQKNKIMCIYDLIPNFYDYMNGIIKWNEKINLTSITDPKEFIVKHFIDSLSILEYMKSGDKVIDIGTGAGFPGMPLKIASRRLKVTLVDSVNKKLNAIREITDEMGIRDVEIVHGRAEDLGNNKEYREKFDIATTRAVSNLSTLAEYMLPLLKIGGKAICMKGPNYEEELKEADKAIKTLGGKLEKIDNLKISGELERNIIIILKIRPTPSGFPRTQGKPLKSPIR